MLRKAHSVCLIFVVLCITFCQAKGLGEGCTIPGQGETNPCTVENAECITDKCKCSTGFTEEAGACKISLGKRCVRANECVSNSKCDGTEVCSCADGYVAKDGLCSSVIGSPCTIQNGGKDCDLDNMQCIDNLCACAYGYSGSVTCKKIVGTSCTAQTEHIYCHMMHTECREGACACKAGFQGDTCERTYESSCNSGAGCSGDVNAVCDNGICVCKDDYAVKGFVCTQTVNGIDCSTNKAACDNIPNAVCDTETGKCTCKPAFTMHVDKCVRSISSAPITGFGLILLVLSLLTSLMLF